jgi:S-adenosylmethionine:tRNA ribosyltransferase-isomerase
VLFFWPALDMEITADSIGRAEASLLLSDFQFALPADLIAQTPAEERDLARLLVVDRRQPDLVHDAVRGLPAHLRPGDLVVVNDTRVVAARVFGRTENGGAVELMLIRPRPDGRWLCIGKPARRLREGVRVCLSGQIAAVVDAVHGNGRYTLRFAVPTDVPAWLAAHGEIPLPPYIHRPDGPLPLDATRYQTIFAAEAGAIAAPTAGLHFTDALVAALERQRVELARLTLHVGPGTFVPVRAEDYRQHVMEPEWCNIPAATADAIREAKAAGRRVVAVGTTTTRALESAAVADGVEAGGRWADRFIVPGYRFRVVDALLTNFHLPGSTLLLLVSAFAGSGRVLNAYAEAIRLRYRFYSYGDAMLIV